VTAAADAARAHRWKPQARPKASAIETSANAADDACRAPIRFTNKNYGE
jgi:hypothetical protein